MPSLFLFVAICLVASLFTQANSLGLKKCEDILLSVEGHATKPKAIIQPVPKQGSSLCARF